MTDITKPVARPDNPRFSSGPCAKRPGWTTNHLEHAYLGRSHRSKTGKALLKRAIDETKSLLKIPSDYRVAIVPASDTGAVEMALWSLLGARGIDVLVWESFGAGWASDIKNQLKLDNVRVHEAGYGELPDLSAVDFNNDVVFTWNGTTSGVRVANGDWIAEDRQGLTICDATSAVFAQNLDWPKLDVVTFSWQKVLGGEGAHGMLILSPRAAERLETYVPPWPLPKVFRLTKAGKLIEAIFTGATINTPSMLCVEDYLDTLEWARKIGGLEALVARANDNAKVIGEWVERTSWVEFLCDQPELRSNTSVCLKITDDRVASLSLEQQRDFTKKITQLLDDEDAAFDIGGYRDAPPGLRIWAGSTIEADNLKALTPWLDWAFAATVADL